VIQGADFNAQLSIRRLHCLDFFTDGDGPSKECEVRLNWMTNAVIITRKDIDDFASANPTFASPIKSRVRRETTSSHSDSTIIGPAMKRVRKRAETSLQSLAAGRIQGAMNFELKLLMEFQQANGQVSPIAEK